MFSLDHKIWEYDNVKELSWQKQILLNRKIDTQEKEEKFFSNNFDSIFSPRDMLGVDIAVQRLQTAIKNKEKIMIIGDYDVDGVSGTSILLTYLLKLGAKVSFRIPHRIHDGYGIINKHIDEILKLGIKLVITTDNGIAAGKVATYAKAQGVEIIITDHHLVPSKDSFPSDALTVCNPRQKDCPYPNPNISGAGVSWYLGYRLTLAINDETAARKVASSLLDIVAISIICDCMPLIDENRILVKAGLLRIKQNPRAMLTAISQINNINLSELTARDIGFRVGPLINATGRLKEAKEGVLLYLATTATAPALAQTLLKLNNERREITNNALAEVEIIINAKKLTQHKIIIIAGAWHQGIIGLIAGRITEKYHLPSIVFSTLKGETLTASARSIHNIDITALMQKSAQYLNRFGGHPRAGGLNMDKKNLSKFTTSLYHELKKYDPQIFIPKLKIATIIKAEYINLKITDFLQDLAPFGIANNEPIFVIPNLQIPESKLVGEKKNHLRFLIKDKYHKLNHWVIAFDKADWLKQITAHHTFDLACKITTSNYLGKKRLDIQAIDLKIKD